jgi:alpha-L-rhamnosidase
MSEGPWQAMWEEFAGGSKAHVYGMFPAYFLSAYVLGVRIDGPV